MMLHQRGRPSNGEDATPMSSIQTLMKGLDLISGRLHPDIHGRLSFLSRSFFSSIKHFFPPYLPFPSLLPFIFFPDHYPPSSQVWALNCSFVLPPFHSLCVLYLKLPSVVTSASIRAPQMFFPKKKKKIKNVCHPSGPIISN